MRAAVPPSRIALSIVGAAVGAGLAAMAAGVACADVAEPIHPQPARAEPTASEEAARAKTERARLMYERGDYQGASAAYREAYRLRPSPGVMFNLGQSYRQDGRCEEAALAYRSVLASDLSGPARELAAQQLDAVELCVRAVDLSAARSNRALRRDGLYTMGAGAAALALAGAMAISGDDRRDADPDPLQLGLAIGGGAALTAGVVVYAIAQHRLRAAKHRAPKLGMWKLPIGTTGVAGATWHF